MIFRKTLDYLIMVTTLIKVFWRVWTATNFNELQNLLHMPGKTISDHIKFGIVDFVPEWPIFFRYINVPK